MKIKKLLSVCTVLCGLGLSSLVVEAAGVNPAGNAAGAVYSSELTGEPIDISLKEQRPVAIMVDNEKIALPHYNTSNADIVYEMMNSTANGRITRLMCVYKDWKNLPRTGSIRSVRPTNILLGQEYEAIIIHDGGPFYINDYFARYGEHLSGGFARIKNGKPREFTEYVLAKDLVNRVAKSGMSDKYSAGFNSQHFQFVGAGEVADLSKYGTVSVATEIKLPFPHNSSKLTYNVNTGKYEYSEYGKAYKDAGTNTSMSFENVILQDVSFSQYDKNGYMIYNCIGTGAGFYITNGQAVPITWTKTSERGRTVYTGADGKEIKLNTGKTYIGLVPDDSWSSLAIK